MQDNLSDIESALYLSGREHWAVTIVCGN